MGRYRIVRLLGRGGMGAVYEAEHVDLGTRAAIKTLHPEVAVDPLARARFLREGKTVARIRHPHVVEMLDVGVQDGVVFLVMELMEGSDLGQQLERDGRLSVERTTEIMLPVCAAVAAAHRAGVVHRDLKPDNIFLARDALGQQAPKVLDFGISKSSAPGDLGLTSSAAVMGTPFYMSPEQAVGAKHADAKSDQFTLGVILYECVTGVRPFKGENVLALLNAIHAAQFAPPRDVVPELPARFEAIILRAMAAAPADRFPSVDDLARDLVTFAVGRVRSTWEPLLALQDAAFATTGTIEGATLQVTPTLLASPPASKPDTLKDSAREVPTPVPSRTGRRWRWAAIALVPLLGLAAWSSRATRTPAARVPATASSPSVLPAASAPVAAPMTVLPPAPVVVAPVTIADAGAPTRPQAARRAGRHRRSSASGDEDCRRLANGAFDCSGTGP